MIAFNPFRVRFFYSGELITCALGTEKYLFSKSEKYYTLYMHEPIFTTKIIRTKGFRTMKRPGGGGYCR